MSPPTPPNVVRYAAVHDDDDDDDSLGDLSTDPTTEKHIVGSRVLQLRQSFGRSWVTSSPASRVHWAAHVFLAVLLILGFSPWFRGDGNRTTRDYIRPAEGTCEPFTPNAISYVGHDSWSRGMPGCCLFEKLTMAADGRNMV